MRTCLAISIAVLLSCAFAQADDSAKTAFTDLNYCDLVKNPSSFSGKRIRIRAIYSYMYEVSVLKPPTCCPESGVSIWVEVDDNSFNSNSIRLHRRFPKDAGYVLGTFVGRFESGESYGHMQYRFQLVVEGIEKVEAKAKGYAASKPRWIPKNCESPKD